MLTFPALGLVATRSSRPSALKSPITTDEQLTPRLIGERKIPAAFSLDRPGSLRLMNKQSDGSRLVDRVAFAFKTGSDSPLKIPGSLSSLRARVCRIIAGLTDCPLIALASIRHDLALRLSFTRIDEHGLREGRGRRRLGLGRRRRGWGEGWGLAGGGWERGGWRWGVGGLVSGGGGEDKVL